MSVIQIAKIQVRRGQENQTGIPTLAGGEFAWAADTEKLYIGLRREDGGSRDANVEILTENSVRNLFATIGTTGSNFYIYREGSYITAVDGTNEFERTIIDKLDDRVNVTDFGAVGNGIADDTEAIQIAIDNLFLNAVGIDPNPVKELFFPAGIYKISDTIYIPKYTTIVGEGVDKTVFNLISNARHAFQTVDSKSTGLILGEYITFDSAGTIDSNTQPDYVRIESATIQHDQNLTTAASAVSLVSLDCANNAVIKDVKFVGHMSTTTNKDYAGIDIRGYSAVTSENIFVDHCEFRGLYSGVKSNHDILNPIIHNSKFDNLTKGISFCEPIDPLGALGPRFGRFVNNRFENIAQEAIYIGANVSNSSTYHVSQGNQFVNVGNGLSLDGELVTTGTAVISFYAKNNSSVNDYFDRYEFQMRNLNGGYFYKPLISGRAAIDSATGVETVVEGNSTGVVMKLPITGQEQHLTIKYTAQNSSVSRQGILTVNIGKGTSPANSITDEYNFTSISDGALTWSTIVAETNRWIEIRVANGTSEGMVIQCQSSLLI
jgi:hypothetical protein